MKTLCCTPQGALRSLTQDVVVSRGFSPKSCVKAGREGCGEGASGVLTASILMGRGGLRQGPLRRVIAVGWLVGRGPETMHSLRAALLWFVGFIAAHRL